MEINKIYVWIMKRFNTSMWNANNEQVGGVYIHTQEPDGENVIKIKFTNGNSVDIKEESITDCISDDESLTVGYKTETGEKQWFKISTKKFEMKKEKKRTILDKLGVERPIIDILDKSDKDVLINWGKENCSKSMGVHIVSNKDAKPRKGKSYILNNPSISPEQFEVEEKIVEKYDYSVWTPNWIESAGSIFVLRTEEETMFIFPYTEYSFEVMGSLLEDGFILGCIDFVTEDKEFKNEVDEETSEEDTSAVDELLKSIGIDEENCNVETKTKISDIKKCFENLLSLIEETEEDEDDFGEEYDEEVTEDDSNDEDIAFGHVDDDYEEFEKSKKEDINPENVEIVEEMEEDEDYELDGDAVSGAYKLIAEYMRREKINSIEFWTDDEENVHCDVKICTVYQAPNKKH